MVQKARMTVCALTVLALCLSASVASAAQVKELQLAGIRLGRSALTIVAKYGNPTEIRIGSRGGQDGAGEAGSQQPGGFFPEGPPPGMAGGAPAFPGFETPPPMTFGTPVTPTGPGWQAQSGRKPSGPEVTWIYRFPKNRILEFIINPDGYIIQIAAFGVQWPQIKTSGGITLGRTVKEHYQWQRLLILKYGGTIPVGKPYGHETATKLVQDSYKDVILVYGYPESQQRIGAQLVMKYTEKNRVAFTLLGTTVVGITIAFWD